MKINDQRKEHERIAAKQYEINARGLRDTGIRAACEARGGCRELCRVYKDPAGGYTTYCHTHGWVRMKKRNNQCS